MRTLTCGQGILLLLLLAIAGCGSTTPASVTNVAPTVNLPASFQSFGDSITAGYTLASPGTQNYAYLFATANSLPFTDYAISGSMSCDIPTTQIFANAVQSTIASKALYSLLISTNDIAYRGTGPYEANFNLCQQASIAWLALPVEYTIAATAASVTGSTHIETANHWNSVFTDTAGSSLRFSFSRTIAGPLYLWYRIADGNSGTFTYSLDGITLGTLGTSTAPTIDTFNNTASSLALLRIPAVTAGAHTFQLMQTSTAASGMGIVAIGLPPLTTIANAPRVLVGTAPPQNQDGISQCAPSPVPCQIYTADITANVNLIAGDGLDVELFNTGKYMSANTADFSDNYHPNALGHKEIAHALQDIY